MTRLRLRIMVAGAAAVALMVPAAAQSVRLLGDFQQWSAYAATQNGEPICFAMTEATSVEPTPAEYSQAYLYVTHRPGAGVENEINLVAGTALSADAPATASVGGQDFVLFTEQDAAWLDDAARSETMASAIRAGSTISFSVTSAAGEDITQTFSLSGATAASQAISSEC
ncbi:hypothetical protein GCM10007989_19670 [Devosia pacifica]|uniref:Invasion associated locus B (IalB) protein n=1 Tax=Devosia pacifica TaxID=1335967 RepID=A0A918S6L8_9HYPH|nr:invasion associated locus B family protein [Devosia pacifica]GHA24087.1 hypothetical protein GCM10007989_19670 [Devosia pacifica]